MHCRRWAMRMWLLAQLRVLLVLYQRRSRQALVYSVLVFVLGRRVDMEQSVCLEALVRPLMDRGVGGVGPNDGSGPYLWYVGGSMLTVIFLRSWWTFTICCVLVCCMFICCCW